MILRIEVTPHDDADSLDRVTGTITHNGSQVSVTGADAVPALTDLQAAVDSAVNHGHGECFWREATGDYRWLFRREGQTMRVAVLHSSGTLTGWEHRFWAECDAGEFRDTMHAAIDSWIPSTPLP